MGKTNASVTITFMTPEKIAEEAGEESALLSIELDEERNGGKSSFNYGEKAFFRVFQYPDDLKLTIEKTDGTLTEEGSGETSEEENLAFAQTNESSSSKPVKSVTGSFWFGNSLGAVAAEGTKITSSKTGIGVLNLKYKAAFKRYAISVSTKPYDQYPVVVYINAE